jgi:2,4-dienoyl-CoA reductase-like NADH-dependent reductase (Old Yellow Enzyme family)
MNPDALVNTDVEPLFQPLQVRGLALSNRIVMAPMTRNFSPGGVPGEEVAAYYRRRAEGGTGLLITEGVGIDHPAALGEAGLGESDLPHLHGARALAGWNLSLIKI